MAALLTCAAALIAPQAKAQQVLTPDQMRQAAASAIQSGQPALALQAADALLLRDPADVTALILKARAARDLGQFDIAQPAAAQAWAQARSDVERYDSARVMAQVLASQDKRTRAQLWLRRAAQHAPDDQTRQVAAREFRYVTARNRWNTQINLSLAPNSNINNGSVRDTTQIFDIFTQDYVTARLGGAARALSGTEANLGATLRYRLAESPRYRTDLLLQGSTRRYRLSDKAQTIAPTAKGADFALDSLNLGLVHRWRADAAPVEYQLTGSVGAVRYAGAHYSNSLRVSAGAVRVLTPQMRLDVTLGGDITRGPQAPHADALRLGAGLQFRQATGTLWSGNLTFANSQSDSDHADFRDIRLDISAIPTWSLLGAAPELGVSLRARDYDSFRRLSPDGRRDHEAALFATLNFTEADYYGFIPTLTLTAARTTSSIGLFDVDSIGLQLGVKSAF